jgi:hypothetical protein
MLRTTDIALLLASLVAGVGCGGGSVPRDTHGVAAQTRPMSPTHFACAIAHRDHSSPIKGDSIVPIHVFRTDTIKLSPVHSFPCPLRE